MDYFLLRLMMNAVLFRIEWLDCAEKQREMWIAQVYQE